MKRLVQRRNALVLKSAESLAVGVACCCQPDAPETCADCCRGREPSTLQSINLAFKVTFSGFRDTNWNSSYPNYGFSPNVYVDYPGATIQTSVSMTQISPSNTLLTGLCITSLLELPSPVNNVYSSFGTRGPVVQYSLRQNDCASRVTVIGESYITGYFQTGVFNGLPLLTAIYGSYSNAIYDPRLGRNRVSFFASETIERSDYGLVPGYLCTGTGSLPVSWGAIGTSPFIQFLGIA